MAALALAVLLAAARVFVKIASGSAALIVVGLVAGAGGVLSCRTALVLLMRWPRMQPAQRAARLVTASWQSGAASIAMSGR